MSESTKNELIGKALFSMTAQQESDNAEDQKLRAQFDFVDATQSVEDRESRRAAQRLKGAVKRWKRWDFDGSFDGRGSATRVDALKTGTALVARLNGLFNYLLAGGALAREFGETAGLVPASSPSEAVQLVLNFPEIIARHEVTTFQHLVDSLASVWSADFVVMLQSLGDELQHVWVNSNDGGAIPVLFAAGLVSLTIGGRMIRQVHRRYSYAEGAGNQIGSRVKVMVKIADNLSESASRLRDPNEVEEVSHRNLIQGINANIKTSVLSTMQENIIDELRLKSFTKTVELAIQFGFQTEIENVVETCLDILSKISEVSPFQGADKITVGRINGVLKEVSEQIKSSKKDR